MEVTNNATFLGVRDWLYQGRDVLAKEDKNLVDVANPYRHFSEAVDYYRKFVMIPCSL